MIEIEDYGVLERNEAHDDLDVLIEELKLRGFTTLDAQIPDDELSSLTTDFEAARESYRQHCVEAGFDLDELNEAEVIRVMPYWAPSFMHVLFNTRLQDFIARVLGDYFIVNQVNGLINPAQGGSYSQSPFHRDLPFRHLTMSRPIAINALFALDDFTVDNGATRVIPGSHTIEPFPSKQSVQRLQAQAIARRGTFIILDAMTYHAGGINQTNKDRRAVNHVFTIPAMRQQLHLPSIFGACHEFSDRQRQVLGYGLEEFRSHTDWFKRRQLRS